MVTIKKRGEREKSGESSRRREEAERRQGQNGPPPHPPSLGGCSEASVGGYVFLAVAAILLMPVFSGCTPKGPRDLLAGEKMIRKSRYADAIERLTNAVSIMPTNAQAWNYLGLAYHYSGRGSDAENAYHRALRLNQDLSEARYNLGCLLLEENRPDMARSEFTAFTLRRANSVDGFVKLGEALLGSRDQAGIAGADKAFQEALRLDPTNAEVLNAIGMARYHQRKYTDAKKYFSTALRQRPNFAPAMLNLAILTQTRMQDYPQALKFYREYLSVKPAPPNTDAVLAVVNDLEQRLKPAATPPAPVPASQSGAVAAATATQSPASISNRGPESKSHQTTSVSSISHTSRPTAAVNVASPVTSQNLDFPATSRIASAASKPVNRAEAERAFQQGLEAQHAHRIPDAIAAYESAVQADPSYFEAYYNLASAATEGGNFQLASNAYRGALAIRPDSVDAMYNFALLLKDNGRYADSAAELEHLLAKNPNDSRANLALANLCAQQLHDNVRARQHYAKVLEADPHNAQASDIRQWIADHR